jgi:hypothetical protein
MNTVQSESKPEVHVTPGEPGKRFFRGVVALTNASFGVQQQHGYGCTLEE